MVCTLLRIACLALAIGSSAQAAPVAARAGLALPRADVVARCAWDRPGHDPFMGELVPAIDRYTDIPAPVRARLQQRMAARRYDDLVEIRRDSIRGKDDYRPEIRDMHFGQGRICREVTRAAWSDAMRERGLVYCEAGHCILVPTVCRNVSRIHKRTGANATVPPPAPIAAAEFAFDPPGAGPDVDVAPWAAADEDPLDDPAAPPAPPAAAFAAPDPGAGPPITSGELVSVFDGRHPLTGRSEGFGPPGSVREDRQPREGSSRVLLPPARASAGDPPLPVPEPATAWLMLGGAVALALSQRRRSSGARKAPVWLSTFATASSGLTTAPTRPPPETE